MKPIYIFLALLLVFSPNAEARKKKKKKEVETTQTKPEKPKKKSAFKDFKEVTEGATLIEGYFDMYEKNGKVMLLIPESRLNEEFVLAAQLSNGIGGSGINGGSMLTWEAAIVRFERHGDKIFLKNQPTRFTADTEEEQKSVAMSYTAATLEAASILSIKNEKLEDESKGEEKPEEKTAASTESKEEKAEETGEPTLVVDITPWIVADFADYASSFQYLVPPHPMLGPMRASFDPSRSYLKSAKGFEKNLNFQISATFRTSRPMPLDGVVDGRYLTLGLFMTIHALPEEPMKPRKADTRMGYFNTTRKNFSNDGDFFDRYVRRWRLEPGEKDGELYKPKKPIIYYLDHTIPEELRPIMKAGVEEWNRAFEEAGFKNAIKAEMLPEDADPSDMRYATLRWSTSTHSVYGAIGPSTVDPRTGEILDADILFEANIISRWADEVAQDLPMGEAFKRLSAMSHQGQCGHQLASMLQSQNQFGAAMAMANSSLKGDALRDEFIKQGLKWVTMHEVGHTLGLYHNFESSTATPNDKLHDKAWVAENGLTASVMDYPAVNIAPPGMENGYYWSPTVGTADRWMIAYGYTPDDKTAEEIARQSGSPGKIFGNDFDAGAPGQIDPSTAVFDLGADPLAWGEQQMDMVQKFWSKIPELALTDNAEYENLTRYFESAFSHYRLSSAPAIRHIGGHYTHRDHVGDPSGRLPIENVSVAKQREALAQVQKYVFAGNLGIPEDMIQKFGGRNWLHWGQSATFGPTRSYPLYTRISHFQKERLGNLLEPGRLMVIRENEMRFGEENVLGIGELMSTLNQSIWSEVWEKPGKNIPALRRDLQREFLNIMESFLTKNVDALPADARSLSRYELMRLKKKIEQRLAPPENFDAYSKAHLAETLARIEKTLNAGLEAERIK